MKLAIIYTSQERTPNNEYSSKEMINKIFSILNKKHRISVFEYHPYHIKNALKSLQPDLVFNLAYGFLNIDLNLNERQSDIVYGLENLSMNHIGSPYAVQKACEDKKLCYKLLQKLGISTPKQLDSQNDDFSCKQVIIKERFGACHRNINVFSYEELNLNIIDTSKYIVEEYIHGDEYTVGVLEVDKEPLVLVPGKVVFHGKEPLNVIGLNNTKVGLIPFPYVEKTLGTITKSIYRGLGLRHYCRIDFRRTNNEFKCIDVNCLPNLDLNKSFFPILASYSKIDYAKLIELLVQEAYTEFL